MVGFGGPVSDDGFDTTPRPRLTIFRIIALTICFLGVQFGWALQIAFSTPIFLELGVPKTFSAYAWLAGPISGFLVQPTVGVLSDRCTSRFGRRKPFIFIGTIFIIIGELFISNAVDLGVMFGDRNGSTTRAIVFALIGFWVLDLANNTVQGPCRALLADIAPKDQQNLGGACFSIMLGLGNFFGYTLGGANLVKYLPFFGTNLRAVFTIAMVNLIICVGITLVAVKERVLDKSEVVAVDNPFVTIFKGVRNMPPSMTRVCIVQFFTWMGWFTYLLYITTWVGENIFHGDPDGTAQEKDAFAAGTRAGSIGLAINAVVAVVTSIAISPIKTGIKPIYCVAQVILAVCLLLPIWVTTEAEALVLIAGFGIPWAIVMVYPFTLVSYAVAESETGLYMGVLNIFVVLPQLLIALTIGFIMDWFGGNVASALATGGIFAFISAGLVWILNTNKPNIEVVNTRGYQPLSE